MKFEANDPNPNEKLYTEMYEIKNGRRVKIYHFEPPRKELSLCEWMELNYQTPEIDDD